MAGDIEIQLAILQEQGRQTNERLARIEAMLKEDRDERKEWLRDDFEPLRETVQQHDSNLRVLGKVTGWGGGLLSAIILLILNKVGFPIGH